MLLEDRVVFVTGAGSGIGKEIAELFAREGARIAGFDRSIRPPASSSPPSRAGHGRILRRGRRSRPGCGRARCPERRRAAGRIDVLVNWAGVREIGDVYTMPAEEWENVIAINLSGTFYCASRRRQMRETGGGSIVNLSSVGGLIGLPSPRVRRRSTRSSASQEPRARPRPGRHPCQRALPRRDPHPDDRQYFRRHLEQELAVSVPLRATARLPTSPGGAVLASDQSATSAESPCRWTAASWPRRASSPAGDRRSCPGTRRGASARPPRRGCCRAVGGLVAEGTPSRPRSAAACRRGPSGWRASARSGWLAAARVDLGVDDARPHDVVRTLRPPLRQPEAERVDGSLRRRSRRTRRSRRAGPRPTRRARSSHLPAVPVESRRRPRGSDDRAEHVDRQDALDTLGGHLVEPDLRAGDACVRDDGGEVRLRPLQTRPRRLRPRCPPALLLRRHGGLIATTAPRRRRCRSGTQPSPSRRPPVTRRHRSRDSHR